MQEQREVLAEHFRLAEATHGPTRACRRMRKFGIKYARLHPQPEALRAAFLAIADPDQWWSVLQQWYAS